MECHTVLVKNCSEKVEMRSNIAVIREIQVLRNAVKVCVSGFK